MNIGIIGSGDIGGTLGKLWSQAGHTLLFSSRHPERLETLVKEAGHAARAGTVAEAAQHGEVVLFAPNFWTTDEALTAAGALAGKILIDATNPLVWTEGGSVARALPTTTTAAAELAKKVPQARVIKAYNALPAQVLVNNAHRKDASRVVVCYCGDDDAAKAVVSQLIADSGFVGLDIGPLKNAADQEPGGPLYTKKLTLEEARPMLASIE